MSNPPKHIIFVGAFIVHESKILLGKRGQNEGHLPGYWAVPGGKVDIGNGEIWNIIEKTAAREALEETGVVIEPKATIFSNNSFIRTDGAHVVSIDLICTYKSGEARPLEDTEAVAWATLGELEDYKVEPNTRKKIELALTGD